jgi:hypothetical protein
MKQKIALRKGAAKFLAISVSYFPVCGTTRRIFLGCVKEVRTTKSLVCGAQGEYGSFHVNSFK